VEHGHAVAPVDRVLIAPIVRIADGVAVLEEHFRQKQLDWTFDAVDSGEAPADRYGISRPHHAPPA